MKFKPYLVFAFMGISLIVLTYFLPVWSVSLQSIQYPKNMYPKGIRVVFKFSGVYNGCEGIKEREELATNVGADCLMEMNAINHYIGMYPIVQGRNNPKQMEHPSFYVFDTKKDADGKEVYDPATGKKIRVNVTPKPLIFLNHLMVNSPWIFVLFAVFGLFFMLTPKRLNSFAALTPALAPFFFLGVYIFYLYWYGHNLGLHGGGAFAGIKPFMPTVFGEGKVAQFTTQSYPSTGFFAAFGGFIFMMLSLLLKRKALKAA